MGKTKKKLVSLETFKNLLTKSPRESTYLSKLTGNTEAIKKGARNPPILKETTPGFVSEKE